MFEALGEWMGFPAYFPHYGGSAPLCTGAAHGIIYPYGPFTVGDGKTVYFSIQNEREWASVTREWDGAGRVLSTPERSRCA